MSYKPPVNYRAVSSRTPSPESFTISGGIALLSEAPANPGDVATPMTVTVNGVARTRVVGTPASGQYRVQTSQFVDNNGQTITEYLPVLEFHSSDEGLAGTADYYRTGTVITADLFAALKRLLTPIVGIESQGALISSYPASNDPNKIGGPGSLAFLSDGSLYFSDGSSWRQVAGAVGTAYTGALSMGQVLAITTDASYAAPGNQTGTLSAAIAAAVSQDATWSAGGGSFSASDDFNRANGTLGANWTTITSMGDPAVLSNMFYANVNSEGAYWNAGTPANNQWAQASTVDRSAFGGPAVRISTTQKSFYFATAPGYDDGEGTFGTLVKLAKYVNGTYTSLGQYDIPSNESPLTLRIEANGTTIRVLVGGVERISVTDSSLTSGSAGIAVYDSLNSNYDTYLENWSAGDL